MVEVTQEDRDLVAWFARRSDTIRALNCDGAIDRLIATHRTTTLAAKEAENSELRDMIATIGENAAKAAKEYSELISAERAKVERLERLLVSEREENLWNAYHTGHEKDGRWTHMFMSDGEWLAQQCGFDTQLPDYDAAEIKAAIPIAARTILAETQP